MPIGLKARRAVTQRLATARRVFRRIDIVRQQATRCFGPIVWSFGSLAPPSAKLPSQQLVRIDVDAYLHVVGKGKAVDHFADGSREPDDGSGT
jgi:hypothetical protein